MRRQSASDLLGLNCVSFCSNLICTWYTVVWRKFGSDSLVNELNEKRKEAMDIETDQKLQVLERALAQENAGQGIGFTVHGVVVDRKTLSRIFLLVMGTLGMLTCTLHRFHSGHSRHGKTVQSCTSVWPCSFFLVPLASAP